MKDALATLGLLLSVGGEVALLAFVIALIWFPLSLALG